MEEDDDMAIPEILVIERPRSLSLAIYVQLRREKLRLTITQAARLSGLEFSEWCALEAGWIPDSRDLLRAIAGTLEASTTTIVLLAGRQPQVTVA